MELDEIRGRWNEVLDALLLQDRIAWLAYFDARLANFDGKTLTLDFSDSRKLGSSHEFSEARERAQQLLSLTMQSLFSLDVTIVEK
jgi:hypothetical protein